MISKGNSVDSVAVRNEFYEVDFEQDLKKLRFLLKSIGLWRSKESGLSMGNVMMVVSIIACVIIGAIVIVPFALQVVVIENSIRVQVMSFGPLFYCLTGAAKYWCILTKKKEIGLCIDLMSEDWRNVRLSEERKIMLRATEWSNRCTNACAIFMFSGTLGYTSMKPLFTGELLPGSNVTTRKLALPVYYGTFDFRSSPIYEISYLMQIVLITIICTASVGASALAAKLVSHICGQCQIIVLLLKDLVDGKQKIHGNLNDRWAAIIETHVRIIRFTKKTVSLLKEICLVECLGSSAIICLVVYYLLTAIEQQDTVTCVIMVILFVSFTLNIFVYCFISEELAKQYDMIGTTSFEIDWYRLPAKKISELIMVIMICQIPPRLSAGKIVALSLTVLGDILKGSMVYLNVLRNNMM